MAYNEFQNPPVHDCEIDAPNREIDVPNREIDVPNVNYLDYQRSEGYGFFGGDIRQHIKEYKEGLMSCEMEIKKINEEIQRLTDRRNKLQYRMERLACAIHELKPLVEKE